MESNLIFQKGLVSFQSYALLIPFNNTSMALDATQIAEKAPTDKIALLVELNRIFNGVLKQSQKYLEVNNPKDLLMKSSLVIFV
jgi:hypothetical protein